ncbi:hypothetical protein BDV30DRAFT_211347 [Aspergillus minisclerotigenes]|uniref:Uncharacterized protein n=1 Tax=Aspergillus minisclerotigenes TaxID=656917 RepID=A0A5N6J5P6_9EURO|nr:hypothetical protein BDV30DRAFT_211347 [Aspergillus minisclerotigenes]
MIYDAMPCPSTINIIYVLLLSCSSPCLLTHHIHLHICEFTAHRLITITRPLLFGVRMHTQQSMQLWSFF